MHSYLVRVRHSFNRPLTLFARYTQTDTDLLPLRLAEAKTVNSGNDTVQLTIHLF